MADRGDTPCIYVLAGTNGAGKSSVGGAMFRQSGAEYFDPDEAALSLRSANPGMTQEEANSAAWLQGKRLLERAISERLDFAFETTLGGRTMAALLEQALDKKWKCASGSWALLRPSCTSRGCVPESPPAGTPFPRPRFVSGAKTAAST